MCGSSLASIVWMRISSPYMWPRSPSIVVIAGRYWSRSCRWDSVWSMASCSSIRCRIHPSHHDHSAREHRKINEHDAGFLVVEKLRGYGNWVWERASDPLPSTGGRGFAPRSFEMWTVNIGAFWQLTTRLLGVFGRYPIISHRFCVNCTGGPVGKSSNCRNLPHVALSLPGQGEDIHRVTLT